jgi:hypothetical protein
MPLGDLEFHFVVKMRRRKQAIDVVIDKPSGRVVGHVAWCEGRFVSLSPWPSTPNRASTPLAQRTRKALTVDHFGNFEVSLARLRRVSQREIGA